MNPGYDDAMQSYLVGGFVRHIRRAILAFPAIATCLAMLVMVPTIMTPITTTARAGDAPINLCDYSGPTFDEVNALLHDRVRPGDHVDRLRDMLSATPGFQFGKTKPARFINFTGSFFDGTIESLEPFTTENGLLLRAGVICQRESGNLDVWGYYIHADSKQELIEFQLLLFYMNEKFTARNEALNVNRYPDVARSTREAEKAVTDIWKSENHGAKSLFDLLSAAGFSQVLGNENLISEAFRPTGEPDLGQDKKIAVFQGMLGAEGTSAGQDTLFFRLGRWIGDGHRWLFITYNPETDEIISISADPPKPE